MPIINVPGVGQVNFPDSMSEKEIVEAIERDILKRKPEAKEATLKEKIADIPKALGRGAVGLLETAGIGASAALPEEYEKKARAGIESLAAPAREFLAPETPEVAETVSSKLATGLGSTLPFFLSAPLGLAGRVIAGGMGVSAGAGEARRGAEMAGATPEERRVATALGAPTGLLDIIAPNIGPLKSMLTTALARGGVEGATEAAQNVAQNLIARGVYDPKRDVLEGTAEEGAYGAGVGALASLILDMTLGRRAYQARQAPPSERPEAPEAPEVLTVNTPRVPSGFTAEEAAGLRAEAEEMERARLSGIEEAARERMGEAQELARGLPGFAGTPGANVEMMEAMRQRQAQQAAMEQAQQAQAQKEAERIRLAQIKQIEESTFSSDPVADRLAKDRMLANLQPPTPVAPVAPTAVPEAPAMAGFAAPSQINAQMLEAARARQQQEQQAADKQRRDEIKRIESTTFSADPVQNEMAKRRALEAIGVAPQEPAVAEEPTYEQLQQRIAEAEAQDRKIRPLAERKAISRTRMAPEELEAMGIVPEERVKREAPKYKATEHPENIGFVGLDASNEPIVDLVTAGAKPFPTKKAAELGKRQRADMKIVKVPNGWVLSPKTEAEFAREGKTTVSEFQPGKPKGTPTAAHEFIVARGGLRKDQQANTSFPDENPRVGNRSLFSPTGGMTLSDAAELLREAGYIAEETETAAEAAITSSVRGNRIYTPEGYERAGEMQLESERTEEQRRQEREALFIPDADVFDYFYSDDFYRQPMDEVRRVAENRGVDFEGIAERLANEFPSATQEQYENAVRDAVGNEIRIRALPISEKLMAQEGQGNNATPEGEKIQKELAGKDINQVAQWAINNAPNNFQKLLAQKAKAMIDALQRRGVKMNFEIQGGNRRSPYLYRARGITSFIWDPQKGTQVDLLLNGEPVIKNQNGYASGMDYETVLHELLHVATRTSTKFLPTENQIRKDLVQLFNAVVSKYNADVKAGTLPPVLMKFYKNMNNVLESPDELITWGMTDRDFQNYLATINVGPKQTAFSKLVELIRELVGLAKPFETALEKLVRTTESILVMDLDVVNQSMYAQGYSFGPAPKPTTQMKQQRLFAARRVVRDDLSVRKDGFYFDAKASPLYQTRTAEEVGDFSQQEADKIVALEGRAKKIQDERRWVGKLKDGAWVGTRLDLAVFRVAKKAGLPPVLAVHEGSESKHTKGGFSKGELLRLVPHITLRNVRFNVMQGERERIAEGGEKGRMASADGQYMDVPPNFDGIEVSFNPTREHLFRDALGRAIKYADEVTVLKNRMYARGNIEYYGAEDVPPVPTQPSDSWIMESGQDARKLEQRPAIIDDAGKVSKDQQKNLFDGQDVIQDRLFSRETGFFIDARQSPLYQKRTEADVPIITQELADRALATHAKGARVEGKGIQLQPGDYIGARLDLPIRASSRDIMAGGVPLQAIHMGNASNYAREDGGFYNGRIAKYLPTVTMKNVKFRVNQAEREEIAAGRKKAPMGSADGQFVRSDNPNFDGIELRFNPKREHLFVDAMGRSVKYADEVTVMGDRMYARGHIEYFGNEDFIKPVGVSPTQARVMSVEEAVRQAGPAVERAVTEAARTGRPLPPPIQENLFAQQGLPPFDQAEVAGRKKITPVAAEEQIAIGSEEKYPTTEEKIILYLSNYPNATRKDMVVFDDAIFYKQPDGRYTDDPLGRPDRTDMEFDNELHVRKTIKQYYSSPFASFSLPPGRFAQLKSKAKMAANVPVISAQKATADVMQNPAFRSWFGNSKVVDAEGGPLVVYHHTPNSFSKFVPGGRDPELSGIAIWMTPERDIGRAPFAHQIYSAIRQGRGIDAKGNTISADAVRRLESGQLSAQQAKVIRQRVNEAVDASQVEGVNTMPLYARIENPLVLRGPETSKIALLYPDRVAELRSQGYDGVMAYDKDGTLEEIAVFEPTQVKSSIGNRGTYSPVISDILAAKEAPLQRTQQGQDAMDILAGMGREVKKPEDGYLKRVSGAWDNVRDNPKLVKEQSLGTFRRWADQFQTWAFSSDAALNNQIRREIMESNRGQEEKVGMLLNVSLSQTVNSDAIANLFLMKGNVRWDKELYKWVGEDDINNIGTLSAQLDEIASKHGLNKEEIELIAHTAFEAKRTRSLIRENQEIEAKAEAIRAEAARVRAKSPVAASELSDKASNLLQKRKVIHMTEDQIKAGMTQFELFPELKNLVDTWNGIRENGIRVLTETGLYSREEAENLLANADYVPFFREDQIEEGKGPKEFLRSLTVQADKRMKGSKKPVNDIFDNQVRWAQYAINRGVRNRSALALVDTAVEVGLAQQVKGPKDGDNVVRVWRNGKEEYYSMADPMFVTAFRGLESVAIPTVKFFSKFADVLRQSVVLYPLFGVAQVPQDSFAAMFTSGLKPQYALRIPVLAVKEFVQTLRGKSTTHDILKNVGAAGVRDFTASVIRMDAEVLSGLKKDKSLWDRVKRLLGNVSMAADNAVRQAVFEAAEAQGLSRKEAIEKAFEIFNVRRRGSSQMLGLAGQVIPFFNAYLAAQNVAYRTLTFAGTSPTQREAAFKTLAATTGSVMALSILYAMMNADDEGYEKKATPTRDRLLIIPGTNGIGVPLRADAFILPKVLAEHVYHMLTENGMTDPGKFRESMKSLLANSIFSPTPVPQAVKPLAEAIMNYDFFQQKPLVGVFQQQKELGRQFEDSTSELSKLFGKTGYVSPIVSDHVIRGMFGSFGGLVLYMTNPILAAMSGTTRPDMSIQDAIATIPNASAFVSKEYELGLRKDFYALKEVTDRAASTLSDLKNRSPQEIGAYLEDPKIQQRIALSPTVNRIANQLTQIRKQINMITNIEDPSMSSAKKEEQIRQLRETELRLLKGIDLRRLREMAEV